MQSLYYSAIIMFCHKAITFNQANKGDRAGGMTITVLYPHTKSFTSFPSLKWKKKKKIYIYISQPLNKVHKRNWSKYIIQAHGNSCFYTLSSPGTPLQLGTHGAKTISLCCVTVWSPARLSLKRRQGYLAGFQRSCYKVDVDAGC